MESTPLSAVPKKKKSVKKKSFCNSVDSESRASSRKKKSAKKHFRYNSATTTEPSASILGQTVQPKLSQNITNPFARARVETEVQNRVSPLREYIDHNLSHCSKKKKRTWS